MANDTMVLVFTGNLTKDAELRYTSSGVAICEFSVATSRRIKKNDTWVDSVSFINLALFGKQGESVQRWLTKGTKVCITGELYQDKWEKDGKTHYALKVDVKNLQLLGGKQTSQKPESQELYEDDIPF